MKLAQTFKDAASEEIAWYKALTQAKNEGWKFVVTAWAIPAGLQKHYFKTYEQANQFYYMTKKNKKHWKSAFMPCTIETALKQCWS